jgi:hypothetical protein
MSEAIPGFERKPACVSPNFEVFTKRQHYLLRAHLRCGTDIGRTSGIIHRRAPLNDCAAKPVF